MKFALLLVSLSLCLVFVGCLNSQIAKDILLNRDRVCIDNICWFLADTRSL